MQQLVDPARPSGPGGLRHIEMRAQIQQRALLDGVALRNAATRRCVK